MDTRQQIRNNNKQTKPNQTCFTKPSLLFSHLHSQFLYTSVNRDIGVYTTGGRLQEGITDPGYHLKLPVLTSFHDVQVTWQTDRLTDVMCGSSQGGHAYLDIEVVNKLNSSNECMLKVIGEHTIDYDKSSHL